MIPSVSTNDRLSYWMRAHLERCSLTVRFLTNGVKPKDGEMLRSWIELVRVKSGEILPRPVDFFHSTNRAGQSNDLILVFTDPIMAQSFNAKIRRIDWSAPINISSIRYVDLTQSQASVENKNYSYFCQQAPDTDCTKIDNPAGASSRSNTANNRDLYKQELDKLTTGRNGWITPTEGNVSVQSAFPWKSCELSGVNAMDRREERRDQQQPTLINPMKSPANPLFDKSVSLFGSHNGSGMVNKLSEAATEDKSKNGELGVKSADDARARIKLLSKMVATAATSGDATQMEKHLNEIKKIKLMIVVSEKMGGDTSFLDAKAIIEEGTTIDE